MNRLKLDRLIYFKFLEKNFLIFLTNYFFSYELSQSLQKNLIFKKRYSFFNNINNNKNIFKVIIIKSSSSEEINVKKSSYYFMKIEIYKN